MRKGSWLTVLLVVISLQGMAQQTWYAVADGAWNLGTTWSNTGPGGSPGVCASGCVAGVDFPGQLDDVFTNGHAITVTSGATCKNLGISYDKAAGLTMPTGITITGMLSGWDDTIGLPRAPIVAVLSGSPFFTFSTTQLDGVHPFLVQAGDEIISFWNSIAPMGNLFINAKKDCKIDAGDFIFDPGGNAELRASLIIMTNTSSPAVPVTIYSDATISGVALSGGLTIAANTTFTCDVPIYGTSGSPTTSKITTLSVNGTMDAGGYVNTTTTTVSATGTLISRFNGANQTQGWWYGTTSPTTISLNNASTVKFDFGNQNVPTRTYGNLILGSSGTKTLATAAAFVINGTMTVESGVTFNSSASTARTIAGSLVIDGTWSPAASSIVTFSGTTTQSVSGSGTLTFGSLVQKNNTSTLTWSLPSTFSAGISSSSGAFNLNSTPTISGGLTVNGGTMSINASASVAGGISVATGTLNLNGATTVSSGGVTVTSGALNLTSTANITGNVGVNGGTLDLGNGTVTIGAGTFSVAGTVTSGTSGTLSITGSNTLSGAGSMTLNNLTVAGSTTVNINNTAWSITGNISNSGTLTLPSNSTVTFSGGNAQNITSSSLLSIGNMVVNKPSATLSNNGNVELFGTLSMTTGTFDADGSGGGVFTLNSDPSQDARVGTITNGSIVGNVTFERYFSNGINSWRHLAFPVTTTYTQLSATLPLAANSLATYNESTLGDVDQGWTTVSGGTLSSTLGHAAWMYNTNSPTISLTGPLVKGTNAPANYGVTYTNDISQPSSENGWNLVGNPYASPINWNSGSGWTKTNVNGTAVVWDSQALVYLYSNSTWDGHVAHGQSFWVQTNAASPVLTSTEAVKVGDTNPNFYRIRGVQEGESKLMVNLTTGNAKDVAMIQFREDATAEFDPQFDAFKLLNSIHNLSSITEGGLSLASNLLPQNEVKKNIRLKLTDANPGQYIFTFEGLSSFVGLDSLVLKDNFKNTTTRIQSGGSYPIAVTADSKSYGSSRFELIFYFADPKKVDVVTGLGDIAGGVKIYPNPASGSVNINLDGVLPVTGGTGEIQIYSLQGALILKEEFDHTMLLTRSIDLSNLLPGMYVVTIRAGDKIVERRKLIVR